MGYDAAGNAVTNKTVPGEWLFSESNYQFTRESGTLENDATIAGTQADVNLTKTELVGLPVLKDTTWRFATQAEVAAADPIGDGGTEEWGFVIGGEPTGDMAADDVTGIEYAILARGPAIINLDMIPTNDAYGTALVAADYALLAKKLGIKAVSSPATTTLQVNQ